MVPERKENSFCFGFGERVAGKGRAAAAKGPGGDQHNGGARGRGAASHGSRGCKPSIRVRASTASAAATAAAAAAAIEAAHQSTTSATTLNSQPASQPATNSNKNQNHQQTNKQTNSQPTTQANTFSTFFPWLPGLNPLTLIPAHPISSTYQPPLQSAIQTTSAQPPTPLLHPLFLSFSRACFPASLWSSVLHFGSWKPGFCFEPRVR